MLKPDPRFEVLRSPRVFRWSLTPDLKSYGLPEFNAEAWPPIWSPTISQSLMLKPDPRFEVLRSPRVLSWSLTPDLKSYGLPEFLAEAWPPIWSPTVSQSFLGEAWPPIWSPTVSQSFLGEAWPPIWSPTVSQSFKLKPDPRFEVLNGLPEFLAKDTVWPRGVLKEQRGVDATHQTQQTFDVRLLDGSVLDISAKILRRQLLNICTFDEIRQLLHRIGWNCVFQREAVDSVYVGHQEALCVAGEVFDDSDVVHRPHVGL